jgi:hypothetical protein
VRPPLPRPERRLDPRAAVACGMAGIALAAAVIGIGSHSAPAAHGAQSVRATAPSTPGTPAP